MANLAIGSMVMDPTDPNVIYAGTGEGFSNADSLRGAGIFKTIANNAPLACASVLPPERSLRLDEASGIRSVSDGLAGSEVLAHVWPCMVRWSPCWLGVDG